MGNIGSQELRDYSVAFVIVILLVVGTLGGYYVGSTAKNGAAPEAPCSIPIGPPTHIESHNGTEMTAVYQMTPGSSATVCVTYTFDKSGIFSPSYSPLQCGPYRAANRTIIWNCPGQIAITPSIQPFSHSSHQNLTVAYTLQAPLDDSGVYWFWLDCGDVVPIAVGALPASLVYPITPGCIYETNLHYRASVVGVSNMGVTIVPVG